MRRARKVAGVKRIGLLSHLCAPAPNTGVALSYFVAGLSSTNWARRARLRQNMWAFHHFSECPDSSSERASQENEWSKPKLCVCHAFLEISLVVLLGARRKNLIISMFYTDKLSHLHWEWVEFFRSCYTGPQQVANDKLNIGADLSRCGRPESFDLGCAILTDFKRQQLDLIC